MGHAGTPLEPLDHSDARGRILHHHVEGRLQPHRHYHHYDHLLDLLPASVRRALWHCALHLPPLVRRRLGRRRCRRELRSDRHTGHLLRWVSLLPCHDGSDWPSMDGE